MINLCGNRKMSSSLTPLQWLCLLFLFTGFAKQSSSFKVFNVLKFGAKRDGRTDNSKVFMHVWEKACALEGGGRIFIPQGNYIVSPVTFEGPCKGYMEFELEGFLRAPNVPPAYFFTSDFWIKFIYIDGFKLIGSGTFDAQGAAAWPYNDCNRNKNCKLLPTSIRFDFVTNAIVHGIRSIDSKLFHINIFGCKYMTLQFLTIKAPENSPNTDGIHMGMSNDIKILHSTISTGDDCISIGHGSVDVYVSDVTCGPGHGISVGSLGSQPGESDVTGLIVNNCTFIDTMNGVRIKTWAAPYPGIVKNFTFQGIYMDNVNNPILIDQQYCPYSSCNTKKQSLVRISDITYESIWGTSASKVAINLLCSKVVPCKKIMLKNINLQYKGPDGQSSASCLNAQGFSYGQLIPPSCLPR